MFKSECSELEIKTNLQELVAGLPASDVATSDAGTTNTGASTKEVLDIGVAASVLNKLSSTDVKIVIGTAIKAVMTLMGSIALAMFIYGGVLWMSSAGNAERSKKGLQVILWAALGMFMILISYAVVRFIFSTFI